MKNPLWQVFLAFLLLPTGYAGLAESSSFADLERLIQEYHERGPLGSNGWRWSSTRRNLPGSLVSMYLPSLESNETSDACKKELRVMIHELKEFKEIWPIRMVDSWGKLPDGLLWGNFHADGDFDQCLAIKSQTDENGIQGKYCSVIYAREPGKGARWLDLHRSGAISKILRVGGISATGDVFPLAGNLIYGTCMPSSCKEADLEVSIAGAMEGVVTVLEVHCQTNDDQIHFLAGDIVFITLLSFLLILMLASAALDIYIDLTNNQDMRKGPVRFLLVFSLSSNLRKLFHVSDSNAPGTIACIHGIRVLSMCWVVYGHQQYANMSFISNLAGTVPKTKGLMFKIIEGGSYSVDTFFFLSGLLVSYSVMRELKKSGRFDVLLFYVHRIIRLTPPVAVAVGFSATILRLLATGPRSFLFERTRPAVCRTDWWKDILYVNNFLAFHENGVWLDCLGQAWYIAVDMQLFLVAPLLLLPLHFYSRIGKVPLYLFSLASVLTPALVTVIGDYSPGEVAGVPPEEEMRRSQYIYVTPWCRAGPWAVGLWTGYVLFKHNQKKINMEYWLVVAGWTLAVFLALAVMFGMWGFGDYEHPIEYTVMTQFFHGGFARTTWAVAVAWVVFACHTGNGGVVNSFLSYPAWQPLSRLTYAMYLMSLELQEVIGSSLKTSVYFNHTNKILETCGSLLVTGIAATLLSISVESPIISLEKLIFKK